MTTKVMIVAAVVSVALLVPASVRAHEGHSEKVLGSITSVAGSNVMVKTTDGKTRMVMLNAKTRITRGQTKVGTSTLKVGDRIVAEGPEEKAMIMANTVKLDVRPVVTAAKSTKPAAH